MDLKLFLRTLLRRWPILMSVFVLAAGATYGVVDRVGPTYETVGSTLIFPPADVDGPGPTPAGGNPYLELGALVQARDIVIRSLTSKTVRAEIAELFPGMTYDATPDYTNNAPIILFTVEAGTPDASAQGLTEVMGRVPATLAVLQSGQALSEQARITSVALTEDLEPESLHKDQIRAGILVGSGVLGAGLLLIALVDGMLAVARRRRQATASGAADEDVPEVETPDAQTEPDGESEVARPARLVSIDEHPRTGGRATAHPGRTPAPGQAKVGRTV